MGGVRNRKKNSARPVAKSATTSAPPQPPTTTETLATDCLLFLLLGALLCVGIGLIQLSYHQPHHTQFWENLFGYHYDCDYINVAENIVGNGLVHGMLRQIAERNPQYDPQILADNVVQFDNLLTPEESENMIAVGKKYEFENSLIVVNHQSGISDMDNELRTSKTLWCRNDCEMERIMKRFSQRLEALLQISNEHFEPIQLLEYKLGEFYGNHSDFAQREISRRPGPRIFTLLFYLNDVQEGGETLFNELNIKVTPKAGRAILWSNCLNHNVHQRDGNSNHEALVVKAGFKYAGNVWVHLRNYREPILKHGCLQVYESEARLAAQRA